VNAKSTLGATALMSASGQEHLDVVKTLLAANADANAAQNSYTALMLASQNGHLDMVQTLLDSNADVNAKSTLGLTALTLAVQKQHNDVAELLRQRGGHE
jgi:ankyrin repeat protein